MKRRQFLRLGSVGMLAVNSLSPLLCRATPVPEITPQAPFAFSSDGTQFLLHQCPFQIRSGEMHPARIPPTYWQHRIQMAKAMGMNTIAIYVIWNFHEIREGEFDFSSADHDIVAFIRLCQQEGMWVLLRAGPYICGEWDNGGIPVYLLNKAHTTLRANSRLAPDYMTAAARYIQQLAARIQPLMIGNGGPILMVQIENEYGSFGNDHAYLKELRQIWINNGINGPFYTQDGLPQLRENHTTLDGAAIGLSGGELRDVQSLRNDQPHAPVFCGELYPGWLTHWGEAEFQGRDVNISATLRDFMRNGISFNIYVIHGGSNFAFSAGANTEKGAYQPDITSYDYAAPINEQGRPTAAYFRYRKLIAAMLKTPPLAIPTAINTFSLSDPRLLTPSLFASVWDNLPAPVNSAQPQDFESLGLNAGLVLYRHRLTESLTGDLHIPDPHDYATVFLDDQYLGGISRMTLAKPIARKYALHEKNQALTLPANPHNASLDILVEAMGHVNYGRELGDHKGLLHPVTVSQPSAHDSTTPITLQDWEMHPLALDRAWLAALNEHISHPNKPGLFFKLILHLNHVADTYIDMRHWCKGMVWVNGNNLGRYWEAGPQFRLYCPAPYLQTGANEILIFDLHQLHAKPISLEHRLMD